MHSKISVIGAAIMDIMGFPVERLISKDSVPGQLKMAPGGVGRNMAENLARLKVPTQLITAFGDDPFSQIMIKQAEAIGLDIRHSLRLSKTTSAIHLAILDHHNDLSAGIAFLDPLESLQPTFFVDKMEVLQQQEIVVIEANIPQNTIEFLSDKLTSPKLFLDPVSIPLSAKVVAVLGRFHSLKANRMEAAALTGIALNEKSDLQLAVAKLHHAGLQNVFITLGGEGVFYSDSFQTGQISLPATIVPVNTTGAGDAFMAGLVYGSLRDWDIKDCAKSGMAAAQIAIRHVNAVNPTLTDFVLEKELLHL